MIDAIIQFMFGWWLGGIINKPSKKKVPGTSRW